MHDTVTKGTHSELLAITALLANGWDVAEPIAPRRFDLVALPPGGKRWVQIQVKTARQRKDRNGEIVVYAKKNNGEPYTLDEAEYIIGIYENMVYIFPNRGIGEYWVRPELIDKVWTHLPINL